MVSGLWPAAEAGEKKEEEAASEEEDDDDTLGRKEESAAEEKSSSHSKPPPARDRRTEEKGQRSGDSAVNGVLCVGLCQGLVSPASFHSPSSSVELSELVNLFR